MPGHLECLNCGLLDSDLSLSTLSIQHSNIHALITLSDHPSLLEIIFCAKKYPGLGSCHYSLTETVRKAPQTQSEKLKLLLLRLPPRN